MRLGPRRSTPLPLLILFGAIFGLGAGCVESYPGDGLDELDAIESEITLAEGFESGAKTAYAAASVTLSSGAWYLDEALLGTSSADAKLGAKSARVRGSGRVTMQFDRTAGAGTVTIRHARYGSDGSGTWALFSSQNGGASWSQVGSQVSTTSTALATATFTVNVGGAIRFEIRKLDGGSNRINFDDVTITDGGGGGGGGGSGASISVHTTLGLPSPASTSDWDSYLSVKSGYVLSYNSDLKIPNWVSWELTTSYLGSTPRQDTFRADDTLPAGMPQAQLSDYSGSGYDRGHMCPSADRTLTVTANSQTFYLSNMIPQAANNNQGPWAALETESRTIAQGGKQLYIIAGGIGGSSSVGAGVRVPDKTFKVIVVLDTVGQGATAVTTATRVIGVVMPNNNSISTSSPWRGYRVSVDSIEAQTGFDLLSDIDPAVESVIEARIDNL
jgi:endonuclease G